MDGKKYIRDKRSPKPKNENVSKVMSANKAKNSNPEILLRKFLWRKGLKGYRLNYAKIPGKPDIVFVSRKVAIFVHGCFWHRCPTCNFSLPKNNIEFWQDKFEANENRDKRKNDQLAKLGWAVIVVWECSLKDELNEIYTKIKEHFR